MKQQKYIIPKAQPNTEAALCQYFALCQKKLSPCEENPITCSLKTAGMVDDKGTFSAIKPEKYYCPKLEVN
jgi:hypothetical protein